MGKVLLRWKYILLTVILWCFITLATYMCLREDEASLGATGRKALAADDLKAKRKVKESHNSAWDYVKNADEVDHEKRDSYDKRILKSKETEYITNGKTKTHKNGSDLVKGSVDTDSKIKIGVKNPKVSVDDDVLIHAKKRSQEYCNPLIGKKMVSEGDGPKGYHLLHVHLVIRHGDRSPMYTLPNHKPAPLSCKINTTQHPHALAFISAMQKVPSSMRKESALHRFDLYPKSKDCTGAQLTGQGALQHLQLGTLLHRAYIDKHKLLQSDAQDLTQLYVRTTDYSRTFQSAIAFLYGLLPRLDFTKLGLDISYTTTLCSQKLTGLPCKCPLANSLHNTVKKEQRKRTVNNTLSNSIKHEVSELLDVPSTRLPWVAAMLEVLMGHACHHRELPCVHSKDKASYKCFPWSLVHKMWTYSDTENMVSQSNYASHKSDRLNMHPLLYEIANRMLNITRGREKSRMVLYSGHDLTMTPLLKVLGLFDGKWPPYASRLAIETWQNSESKQYFIRVVYNGQDRTSGLRFCAEDQLLDGLCPMDNLVYFVRYRDLQFFGKSSYADACTL